MTHPVHWERINGPLVVEGTVPAPTGAPVRALLHFDNHRMTFEAAASDGRFARTFAARPAGVRADTDLQVEIIDGAGRRTLLPQVWLRWTRPGENVSERQSPQTADLGPYLVHPRHSDALRRPRM